MKTPEISEFSYGFALTNELAGWAPLKIAPVFLSLIEEGKEGGGYDVKLEMPGVPLYLQFKRGFRMIRRTAKEVKQYGKRLTMPFHRFYITDSGTSDQHTMLLGLDDGKCDVFYAAPRFDRLVEINHAWANKQVADRSIFVAPQAIGPLDDKSHHVAYDAHRTFLCSEPQEIACLSATQILQRMSGRLKADSRPLEATLPELIRRADDAARRAKSWIAERRTVKAAATAALTPVDVLPDLAFPPLPSQVPTREQGPLSEPKRQLRELADKAYQQFDVQLAIVQPPD